MRPYLSIIGFLIFTFGVISVIMSLVGLKVTLMNFIYGHGVWTFVIQLLFIFGGMILFYVSRIDPAE
ncbi:MAG: hypothetical protein R2774_14435 [Saprospiraceae bacterium]